MSAKVWVIGAGKGGVGKTFITSCLGVTLSKLNQSVLLIDFDLAGANLHTPLGLPLTQTNLQMFLTGQAGLGNLIQQTNIPRLSYIQGVWDEWSSNKVSRELCAKLIQAAHQLPFDYVLIDLGPGANTTNVEMMKLADEKIVVCSAEPTAIEKTYRYIEAFIVDRLHESATPEAFAKLERCLKKYRLSDKVEHFSFREYLAQEEGFTLDHFEPLNQNPLRLIINGARNQQDQQLGHSMKSVCAKYFDLHVDYLGAIDYDNAVWQSVRSKTPVLIDKPFTSLAGQFLSICKILAPSERHTQLYRAVV